MVLFATGVADRELWYYFGMENSISQSNNEKGQNPKNIDNKQNPSNESLNEALSELSLEDAEMVREEFKILNKAIIPGLENKIGSFKLIEDMSEEIKQLAESGRMPAQLRDQYGTQEDLDKLLDELNESKKNAESLKENLLNKNTEAIKEYRKKRIEAFNEKFGHYSLTGKEYQDREDKTNRKIAEERRIKEIRDDLNNLMSPN